MLRPHVSNVKETVAQLAAWSPPGTAHNWVIVLEVGGPAVGRVALIERSPAVYEAAIMMCPKFAGRGLAKQALMEVIDEAFQNGARRIYADIDPDNVSCIRLFEGLGFHREGYLRARWKTHIGVRDTVLMGLIDRDLRPRPA